MTLLSGTAPCHKQNMVLCCLVSEFKHFALGNATGCITAVVCSTGTFCSINQTLVITDSQTVTHRQ